MWENKSDINLWLEIREEKLALILKINYFLANVVAIDIVFKINVNDYDRVDTVSKIPKFIFNGNYDFSENSVKIGL